MSGYASGTKRPLPRLDSDNRIGGGPLATALLLARD
jgi:hypothetical protein